MAKKQPTIIIDTREKKPFVFRSYKCRKQKLVIGDYSAVGYANQIAVEYKSVPDFLSWINPFKPKRFNSQLKGLTTMHYSCVIVGGRIDSKSNYSAVSINRTVEIVAMLALLNVPIVFASKRSIAEKIIAAFIEASIDDIRARELYRLTH